MTQNLGCVLWRYLGVVMNNSLSFRKESIQRSSSQSEALSHSFAGHLQDQGPRQTRDQRWPTLTVTITN